MNITNEQEKRLNQYVDVLLKWNQKFNLIGKSTVDDVWNRHILDCAQLIKFISTEQINNAICADFGAGAGLPGIVLSILGVKNMTLVEKSPLKCKFLQEAVKISNNKIEIINKNIFEVKNRSFDIIFSRALANLNDLLGMVNPFLKGDSVCYFLKGKKINEELKIAKNNFNFGYEMTDSLTSEEGKIIKISRCFYAKTKPTN